MIIIFTFPLFSQIRCTMYPPPPPPPRRPHGPPPPPPPPPHGPPPPPPPSSHSYAPFQSVHQKQLKASSGKISKFFLFYIPHLFPQYIHTSTHITHLVINCLALPFHLLLCRVSSLPISMAAIPVSRRQEPIVVVKLSLLLKFVCLLLRRHRLRLRLLFRRHHHIRPFAVPRRTVPTHSQQIRPLHQQFQVYHQILLRHPTSGSNLITSARQTGLILSKNYLLAS